MKLAHLLAIVLLFSSLAQAFSDHSLVTLVEFNPNGSAKVTEKITVTFDSDTERQAFTDAMANPTSQSTIVEWKKFSKNVEYHIAGVISSSTRITAKRDFSISYPAGNIIIEYDTLPIAKVTQPTSRVTSYSFNGSGLNFKKLQTGQVILGQSTRLAFKIPTGARFTTINPQTEETTTNTASFLGPLSAKIQVEFETEKSLSQEVTDFFNDLTTNTVNLVPILLALAFITFFAYKLLSPK
jgi:hypothetical protein